MSSVSEEDVRRWFDTAQKWSRANSAENCRDTFKGLDELSSFLKDLERALAEVVWCKTSFIDELMFVQLILQNFACKRAGL